MQWNWQATEILRWVFCWLIWTTAALSSFLIRQIQIIHRNMSIWWTAMVRLSIIRSRNWFTQIFMRKIILRRFIMMTVPIRRFFRGKRDLSPSRRSAIPAGKLWALCQWAPLIWDFTVRECLWLCWWRCRCWWLLSSISLCLQELQNHYSVWMNPSKNGKREIWILLYM